MTRPWIFALGTLLITACGDKEECTEDAYRCDGDVLEQCVDSEWEVDEDCAESDMICHDVGDESHCMKEGAMKM